MIYLVFVFTIIAVVFSIVAMGLRKKLAKMEPNAYSRDGIEGGEAVCRWGWRIATGLAAVLFF